MEQQNIQVMDQQLKQELDQIKKLVYNIDAKMTSVETFLSGNELDHDDKGLVGKVNDHATRIRSLEKQRDRIMYVAIGLACPTGIGIWELVKNVILK